MGFLETAVVIYLRLLYYPNGFEFPLVVLDPKVGLIEIFREAATVVMLLGVGVLAGNSARQRLAFFLMAFAVWDLCYYLFLKILLGWPASLLTWDILFLIPAPWVGPVLSPVIVCCIMLAFSTVLLIKDGSSKSVGSRNWISIIAGSVVVIFSWMWDYIRYSGRITDSPDKALESLASYVPSQFNWWLFSFGVALMLTGIILHWRNAEVYSKSA